MASLLQSVLRQLTSTCADVGEDAALLRRFVADGDQPAFAVLLRRHGGLVWGVCRQMLPTEADAEDAFQATFLVLASKAGSIRRPELLGPWLYGVAVRVARKLRGLNQRRRRREVPMTLVEPVGDSGRLDLGLVRVEEIEALHEELARLPETYRAPLVLCDLGGLTHVEAAERLRWPSGSLGVRLSRARGLLRERLTRRGIAPASALALTASLTQTASATVPSNLAVATTRAAGRFAAGSGTAAVGASASASSLAGQVISSVFVTETLLRSIVMSSGIVAVVVGVGISGWVAPPDDATATSAATQPSRLDRSANPVPSAQTQSSRQTLRFGDVRPETELPASPRTASVPNASVDALEAYQALARSVGGEADAQVELALWCEANGLTPERLKHLTLAVLTQPGHVKARALLGQVAYASRWLRPEAVERLVRGDTGLSNTLAAYNSRRERTRYTTDAHWKLALWCEQNGLKAEADAHFVVVTRLDPDHEAAWKRLGCRRVNGRWLNDEQVAAELADGKQQKEANRTWRPLLVKWRGWLNSKDRRDEAEQGLSGVSDPRAVPAIWSVFVSGGELDQRRAVQLFGQIDAPASDLALGILALSCPRANVRKAACETLARRDARQAVDLLVGLLRDPEPNPRTPVVRFQFVPVGALGIGSAGITYVEGRRTAVRTTFTLEDGIGLNGFVGAALRSLNDGGLYQLLRPGYEQRLAMQSRRQVADFEATLRAFLAEAATDMVPGFALIEQGNARLIHTLKNIVGVSPGDSWEDWKRWWVEQRGYVYDPGQFKNPPDLRFYETKPIYTRVVHNPVSCFAAGTPVKTRAGPLPIETIQVGDQVLTQDVRNGALSFTPVLATMHNTPAPTLRVQFEGSAEPVVATDIHRFWKTGQGWVMARDLKPGDAVRMLDGPARVSAVSSEAVQPVFNLDVGETQSYFVGQAGALVHDNSAVLPVAQPFDAVPVYR